MNILTIQDLKAAYDSQVIFQDVNLTVQAGDIVSFIGPSGSGKSTFLSVLNGFILDQGGSYAGQLYLHGHDLDQMPLLERRQQITTLFQDAQPFPMSVAANLSYSLNYFQPHLNRIERQAEVKSLLERINLWDEVKDKLNRPALQLSGVQQQRLSIARMLISQPSLLLLDKPCSSLDPANSRRIEDLLVTLSAEYPIIFSTHNIEQSERIATKMYRVDHQTAKPI